MKREKGKGEINIMIVMVENYLNEFFLRLLLFWFKIGRFPPDFVGFQSKN